MSQMKSFFREALLKRKFFSLCRYRRKASFETLQMETCESFRLKLIKFRETQKKVIKLMKKLFFNVIKCIYC